MKKILISIAVSFFLVNLAFAHDILKNLTKEQLIQVQTNLIKEGYLKEDVLLGTYGSSTEVAFDKYQADRDRQAYEERKQATTTVKAENKGFFSWILSVIRSWF